MSGHGHYTAWITCGLLLLAGLAGAAAPDPARLYRDMQQAVHHTDYEGRFVYQVGPRLDAMYVVHRMQNGRELERLVALNGDPKQVIRGEKAVACLDAHRRRISVVDSAAHVQAAADADLEALKTLYTFSLGERVRVAGRPAIELQIRPRDRLRYGYRIALDEQTRLPLHSVMLDASGRLLSQTLFVDLKTGAHVTPIERDLSALKLAEPEAGASPRPLEHSPWQARNLPPGFRLVSRLGMPEDVQHFLFSDGLTSVSVYIEPVRGQVFEGFSRIGAIELYGTRRGDTQLTVVGEVPRETLRRVAEAMQRQ